MYTALAIMLGAMLIGRILRNHIAIAAARRCIMLAIWLLLFVMGASIGANADLLRRLPQLGWQALALMCFCVAGSIIFTTLLAPLLIRDNSQKRN